MDKSKINLLWMNFFIIFLFSSFNVFANVGEAVRLLPGAPAAFIKKIDDFFMDSAKLSNERIEREFDETLDEILEMKKMKRDALPDDVLVHLREVTMDPMRLIIPDDPRGEPLYYFQNHEYSDIFRAFFQRRLDFENEDHMESLISLLHDVSLRTGRRTDDVLSDLYEHDGFVLSPLESWTEELYASLYGAAMRGVYSDLSKEGKKPFHAFVEDFERMLEEGHADSYIINPRFHLPSADIDENGYRQMVFGYIADNPEKFVGRVSTDSKTKKAFFRFWKDEDFRVLAFDSIRRDNVHLLDDKDLLLKFWFEARETDKGRKRFRSFIEASYKRVRNSHDVGLVRHGDVFWETVLRAGRSSMIFGMEVKIVVKAVVKEFEPEAGTPGRQTGGEEQRGSRRIRHMEYPMAPSNGENETRGFMGLFRRRGNRGRDTGVAEPSRTYGRAVGVR